MKLVILTEKKPSRIYNILSDCLKNIKESTGFEGYIEDDEGVVIA